MRSARLTYVVVLILVGGLVTSAAAPAVAAGRRPTLRSLVIHALKSSTARRVSVAIEADRVGPIVSYGGTRWSRPASTQKLYTGLSALLQLGPRHRPVVEVVGTGPITRGGTIVGDLLLTGPAALLSPDELETVARNVARTGIRRVAGRIDAATVRPEPVPRVVEPGLRGVGALLGRLAATMARPASAGSAADRETARRFRGALSGTGVTQVPRIRPASATDPEALVTRRVGPTVMSLVWIMLKRSDNRAAERLLKLIGASVGDSTTRRGIHVVQEWEARLGVPPGIHGDGSGRSFISRHTAWNEVAWLRAAERTPVAGHFYRALPVACRPGGTLAGRMCGTDAAGRVFAKTGNVRGVITLAGYAVTRQGLRVRFAFMLSGVRSKPAARRAIDRALARLIRYA